MCVFGGSGVGDGVFGFVAVVVVVFRGGVWGRRGVVCLSSAQFS